MTFAIKEALSFVHVFLCGERPALYQDVAGSCQALAALRRKARFSLFPWMGGGVGTSEKRSLNFSIERPQIRTGIFS